MGIFRGRAKRGRCGLGGEADAACPKNQSFERRLGFAFAGIRMVAKSERSFRTQSLLALAAIGATALLSPEPLWWALLALAIGLVLGLECVNAALEYSLDRLHPQLHPEIGMAKDAAAGAVLIASLAAACVGAAMLFAVLNG